MTQNTEQNVRTRDEQVAALMGVISPHDEYPHVTELLERHILEAEARGAEEQRRKDAEGQEPFVYVSQEDANAAKDPKVEQFGEYCDKKYDYFAVPLYTRPANVAALEARVKELEGQITALNTPQYYAAEGDDFCRDSIADILDECDAERNTIIQVNGYRQVSSEWALFDGESLRVFPTENEAEAARAALTREGRV